MPHKMHIRQLFEALEHVFYLSDLTSIAINVLPETKTSGTRMPELYPEFRDPRGNYSPSVEVYKFRPQRASR